jgi:hypothetical protein
MIFTVAHIGLVQYSTQQKGKGQLITTPSFFLGLLGVAGVGCLFGCMDVCCMDTYIHTHTRSSNYKEREGKGRATTRC